MNDENRDALVGAGMQLGGVLLGIAGKAIAGLYKNPEEIRDEMMLATNEFSLFIVRGGDMDKRRDIARAKTDAAIAMAEAGSNQGQRGNIEDEPKP